MMGPERLELERLHAEVLARQELLRARLRDTHPGWWLGGGALAGALAGRLLPRIGWRRLAPAAGLLGALESWALGAAQPLLAQWRARFGAGAAANETDPAAGQGDAG